jgi:RNase P protein component
MKIRRKPSERAASRHSIRRRICDIWQAWKKMFLAHGWPLLRIGLAKAPEVFAV